MYVSQHTSFHTLYAGESNEKLKSAGGKKSRPHCVQLIVQQVAGVAVTHVLCVAHLGFVEK
jgi:hypothetical protein